MLPALLLSTFAIADTQQSVETGSISNSNITINQTSSGYSLRQHESTLKKREATLRADLERAHGAEKALINSKLKNVEKELLDLKESYDDTIKQNQTLSAALEEQKKQNPLIANQLFEEAKTALLKGDTSKANLLFSIIESNAQKQISNAAQAAYQQGVIAYNKTEWLEALNHLERALRYQPENVSSLNLTASMYLQIGENSKALQLTEQVLDITMKQSGENSVQTAIAQQNLASIYLLFKRFDDAELILKKIIQNAEYVKLNYHQLGSCYNTLGYLYLLQGKNEDAAAQLKKAVTLYEKIEGPEHDDIALVYTNLARAYELQNSPEAEPFFLKAIDSATKRSGLKHPNTQDMIKNYIAFLINQGRDASLTREKYGLN